MYASSSCGPRLILIVNCRSTGPAFSRSASASMARRAAMVARSATVALTPSPSPVRRGRYKRGMDRGLDGRHEAIRRRPIRGCSARTASRPALRRSGGRSLPALFPSALRCGRDCEGCAERYPLLLLRRSSPHHHPAARQPDHLHLPPLYGIIRQNQRLRTVRALDATLPRIVLRLDLDLAPAVELVLHRRELRLRPLIGEPV